MAVLEQVGRPTVRGQVTKRTATGCASAFEPTVEKESKGSISLPLTRGGEPQLVVIERRPIRAQSRIPTWAWTAVATCTAIVMLYATITVIVKTKSGKKKAIPVPDDVTEVQVDVDGRNVGAIKVPNGDQPMPPPVPARRGPDTIDLRVAEHVLAMSGSLELFHSAWGGKGVNQIGDLPLRSFKIKSISLPNSTLLHSDHIAMIGQLRHLQGLDVSGTSLTDDDLREIGKVKTLRSLTIATTRVTDEGLASLESLDQLVSLNLGSVHVTPRGMRSVGKLHRLQDLTLDDTGVDDEGLAELAGLARLRRLTLIRARITDAGLKHLAALADLEELNLHQTRISGSGLAHLATLPRLDYLMLDGAWLKDDEIKALQSLPSIHEVNLRSTRLSDAAIEPLSKTKTLTHIDLEGSQVTEAGRARLAAALPNCNLNRTHQESTRAAAAWVFMHGGTVNSYTREGEVPSGPFEINQVAIGSPPENDPNWPLLANLSNLKSVSVAGKVNRERVRQLSALPRLKSLSLAKNPALVAEGGELLSACPLLDSIQLVLLSYDTPSIAPPGSEALAKLTTSRLTSCRGDYTFSDDTLAALPMERLTTLLIGVCPAVTDAGMARLANARDLEWLELGSDSLTDAGLQHFSALTQLRSLGLGGTRTFGAGLSHLSNLKLLEFLDLNATPLNNDGAAALSGLDRLLSLNVSSSEITDAGLEHLKPLKDLDVLYLQGTRVTEAGIADLQTALPSCTIVSNFHPETP